MLRPYRDIPIAYLRSFVLGGNSRYRHNPPPLRPEQRTNPVHGLRVPIPRDQRGPKARAGFITAPVSAPPPPSSAQTSTTRTDRESRDALFLR